jgi:hypothetical protein
MNRAHFNAAILSLMCSTHAFADSHETGSTTPTGLQSISVSITSNCVTYRHGNYPGDWDVMISCPQLVLDTLLPIIASKFPGKTVLKIEATDSITALFLKGSDVSADQFTASRNINVQEGNIQIDAEIRALVTTP